MKPTIEERISKDGRVSYTASVVVHHNGDRARIGAGTHFTRDAAVAAGWAKVGELSNPEAKAKVVAGGAGRTLAWWAKEWLHRRTVQKMGENTTISYEWRMRKWIVPYLGKHELSDLTASMIREWVNFELRLGIASKKMALACLSTCLTEAVELEYIPVNPCSAVRVKDSKVRKMKHQAKKLTKVWTTEECRRMLQAAKGEPIEPGLLVGLYGALRIGEICALRYNHISGTTIWVHVNHVITSAGPRIGDPKSGPREVQIPASVSKRLTQLCEGQAPDALLMGGIHPATFRKYLHDLCLSAEVTVLPSHSLRHTCASQMLSAGVALIDVAHHLGHSNPQITASTYAHWLPGKGTHCTDKLAEMFNNKEDEEEVTE